jgi:hypothetical protein
MSVLNKFQSLHLITKYLVIGLPIGLMTGSSSAKLQPKARNGLHRAKNAVLVGGVGCLAWPIALPILGYISYKTNEKKSQDSD